MGSTFICHITKFNWLIKNNKISKFGTVYDTHQIFGTVAGELVSFYYSFGLTFTNFVSSGAVLQYMSDEDQKDRLDRIKQYLASTSADRKSQTIDNPLFQHSIQKEPVGVPISSPDSDSDESVSNYSSMAQNRTLKELAVPDVDHQPLCIQHAPLDMNYELMSGLSSFDFIPWIARRGPEQTLKGIPYSVFQYEACCCHGRTDQTPSISFLFEG